MFKNIILLFFVLTSSAHACVVLVYHHFDTTTPKSTSISPQLFEEHLKYLKNNDFKVLTLKELVKKLKNKEQLPNKCAVLTADDAYTSIATHAYPLLKKYNFPMSVFVATAGIGKYHALMTYPQMRHISDKVDFFNHSVGHEHFYELGKQEARQNILATQKILHQELGTTEKIFAYPYGEFDKKTYDLLKELDFVAFGQHSGAINEQSDLQRLPRFPMTDTYGDMESFNTKINTLAFNTQSIMPISQIVTTNPPTLTIEFDKQQKIHNLNCFVSGQELPSIVWHKNIVKITARKPLSKGRTKYNCTANSSQEGRFYWLSKQWIVK